MIKLINSNILIVDDNPDHMRPLARSISRGKVKAEVLHPEEVKRDDLTNATLVLVDFNLTDWKRNHLNDSIAHSPSDGLALSTVFRRHLMSDGELQPIGFAILTGRIDELSHHLPFDNRVHMISSLNNMEWVFLKNEENLSDKIISLAEAIRMIPESWKDGVESPREISEILGFDTKILSLERYDEAIRSCRPPIYELTLWSHGLAFLRWMLHKILIYPCFLWDTHRLAARLRLEVDELRVVLNEKSKLTRELSKLRYKGILKDFNGSRWWRDAVERFLWNQTGMDSQNPDKIISALEKLAGRRLRRTKISRPVVCINSAYLPENQFYQLHEVVRVQPDDWPDYADYAYMTIETVSASNALRNLVVPEDREKLEDNTDE